MPSFEWIFCTNNARTTVTTFNQLETYYMDLEEVNPPSNNQNHGRKRNHQNKELQAIVLDVCLLITTRTTRQTHLTIVMEITSGAISTSQRHIIWAQCSKCNTNALQQRGKYQGNHSHNSKDNNSSSSNTTTTTTKKLCYNLIEFTPNHNLVLNFKVDNIPKQNTE